MVKLNFLAIVWTSHSRRYAWVSRPTESPMMSSRNYAICMLSWTIVVWRASGFSPSLNLTNIVCSSREVRPYSSWTLEVDIFKLAPKNGIFKLNFIIHVIFYKWHILLAFNLGHPRWLKDEILPDFQKDEILPDFQKDEILPYAQVTCAWMPTA